MDPLFEPMMRRLRQLKICPRPRVKKNLVFFLVQLDFYSALFLTYVAFFGLYELSSSRIKWKWEAEYQKQFDYVKQCMLRPEVLVPYDGK
ncbi:hypothetical protein GJ496_005224 [Pomphorhynchus laevis]|nr:hypothetical protein GJ496_009568 [Pomphorhynchus laevis]KAI0978452.1 hypothetical protein GJ496_003962 [Pomphorhynchus laevis]KAI0988024.1 hypothetical protein GJ496_005224 [Pomphorhynchus laevis]